MAPIQSQVLQSNRGAAKLDCTSQAANGNEVLGRRKGVAGKERATCDGIVLEAIREGDAVTNAVVATAKIQGDATQVHNDTASGAIVATWCMVQLSVVVSVSEWGGGACMCDLC